MAEQNEIINDLTTDQYSVLHAFQTFTSKYFPDVTPDNSKLGLFGYINEIIAHASKSNMFHRNMLYGEICLNTAMLPSTIYNMAIDENMEPSLARPSKATIIMDLKESDLNDAFNNNGIFIFNRNDFVVKMDDVEFRLPYSLVIKKDNFSISAFYRSVGFTDEEGTVYNAEYDITEDFKEYKSSPFCAIKTYADSSKKENYYSIRLDVFNYKIQEDIETIYSSRLDNRLLFPVNFEDQLMAFKVLYKPNNKTKYTILSAYQNKTMVTDDINFCMYRLVDEQNYQVYFSTSSDTFRLEVNSELKILTYTTEGSKSNFEFTAVPIIDYESYGFEIKAAIYSNPSNGKDRPSTLELKKSVFKERTKTYYKGSEEDLNAYFSEISDNVFGDGSQVLFVKSKDDLLKREFIAYMMIMDENKNPFPTNTANVTINGSYRFIDPSMPIYYDETNKQYLLYNDAIEGEEGLPSVLQSYLYDESKFVYFSPFSVSIEAISSPISNVTISYYNEALDDYYKLNYEVLASGTTDVPVVNYMSTYRNPSYLENIQIKLSVTTETPSDYKFILVMMNKNDNNVKYYMEFKYDNASSLFILEIVPTVISGQNNQRFAKGKMLIDENEEYPIYKTSLTEEQLSLDDNFVFYIYTMEKIDNKNNITDNKDGFDSVFNQIKSNAIFNGWRIKAKISSDTNFKVFESLGNIIRSQYSFNEHGDTVIEMMPLAGGNILYDNRRFRFFMTQLNKYLTSMKNTIDLLTNSTSLNCKLFNTYGVSKTFYIKEKSYDENDAATRLDRTNIHLYIEIDREGGYNAEVDDNIKNICREFINSINENISNNQVLNRTVSLSNLSTRIEQEIPSIISCNVLKINNIEYPRKVIKDTSVYETVMSDSESIYSIITPEYLSLDMKRQPSDLTDIEELNIDINYIS